MKYLICITITLITFSFVQAQESKEYKIHPDSLGSQPKRVTILGNGPLFLIDNMEVTEEELRKIKPEDIQSIQVLKDSTSVSVYGERGKRGVVIIEMKTASSGKPHRKE